MGRVKLNGDWAATLYGARDQKAEVRPFQCTRCFRTFKKEGNLTNHMKSHPSRNRPKNQSKLSFVRKARVLGPRHIQKQPTSPVEIIEKQSTSPVEIITPIKKIRETKPLRPSTRSRKDARTMWRLIQEYESCKTSKEKKAYLAENNIPKDTMKKWRKPKRRLIIQKDAMKRKLNGSKKSSVALERVRKAVYPDQEEELYGLYRLRRAKGLPVDGEYFSRKMVILVKRDNPSSTFKGSNKWISKFTDRFGISLQAKTNKKSKSIQERLPKVRNFHWWSVYQMALEEP